MRTRLAGALLAALALLSACDDNTSDSTAGSPQPPQSWDEYVARERPVREASTRLRYYRQGLPDMRAWKPADFLPAEYLQAEHIRFCELPLLERQQLAELFRSPLNAERENAMRQFAERGVLVAQSDYGAFCREGGAGVSAEEAMEWARRAAASGAPNAMLKLGFCMDNYLEANNVHTKSFFADEILYWHWRAAKNLDPLALMRMFIFTGQQYFEYPKPGENDIQGYKWRTLDHTMDALYGLRHDPATMSLTGKGYPENVGMTTEQVIRSRELARDWLLEHADVLKDYPRPLYCADDPDAPYAGKPYDYALFNEMLQPLGLRFDTASRELESIGAVSTGYP